MSVRPDIAASLQTIQSQLGDDLGGVLDEASTESSTPRFRQTMALEHIGGLNSGGAFELEAGSYRFGRSPGSILFGGGEPQEPRFGLTVSPEGIVTLFPAGSGVRLDGLHVVEPTPVAIGQVIGVGHDRFRLRPKERLAVSRRGLNGEEALPAMPVPSKGRGVDQAVIDWALETRDRELRAHWVGTAGPVQVYYQIERGELFGTGPADPTFGRVLIGTTDREYTLPEEMTEANRATRDELESLVTVMPGLPVSIDLAAGSVAIVGSRSLSRALATWMVLSLAVHTAPDNLGIVSKVNADPVEWSWLGRLPHVGQDGGSKLVVTLINERRPVPVPTTGAIVLLEPSSEVPAEVSSVVRLDGESATYAGTAHGSEEIQIAPIGLASAVAVERSLIMSEHIAARQVA